MALHGALMLALAMSASSGGDRILLCRPKVTGDPALARGDAVAQAGKRSDRFLDYGVVCDDVGEGARAARRMGLAHAVSATAEGRVDGSRYVLVLGDASGEAQRAQQTLDVAPGVDAVAPIRSALSRLLDTLPPKPGPKPQHVAAWTVVGIGAAALVAGTVYALQARGAADRANGAGDPTGYTSAKQEWQDKRTASGVLFAAGGAALAAGLTWRFAF